MKLATLPDGSPDGKLIVVSSDGGRFLSGETVAPSLQSALDHWAIAEAGLRALAVKLENSRVKALHDGILSAPRALMFHCRWRRHR
jgi:fumarylacetoacetate (FAA) hydrolase